MRKSFLDLNKVNRLYKKTYLDLKGANNLTEKLFNWLKKGYKVIPKPKIKYLGTLFTKVRFDNSNILFNYNTYNNRSLGTISLNWSGLFSSE